jgi:hypothetical protein
METLVTVRGLVRRLLPTRYTDGTDGPSRARLYGYGELAPPYTTTDHIMSEEGSYLLATNPTISTGQTWVAAQTAFSDTAPNWYIYNTENPSNPGAKSIHLRFLKMISTAAATSATLIRYAAILDTVARQPTTNNMASIAVTSPNGNVSPIITPTVLAQNSATASVVPASSSAKRLVANGTLGGLNVVGTEFQINFGSTDAGGGQNGVAAETIPNRRVNNEPPVIIGPGQSLMIHVWMAASSASFNPEWALGMWAR